MKEHDIEPTSEILERLDAMQQESSSKDHFFSLVMRFLAE